MPQNTGFLVCPKHIDPLNVLDMPYILPPDPLPVYNARPENYALDESSDLGTEDGDTITTEDGVPITTAIPNPSFTANTSKLTSFVLAPSGSVATAYLDLFDGDPTAGGTSVLATITGSATRTNIAADLTTVNGIELTARRDTAYLHELLVLPPVDDVRRLLDRVLRDLERVVVLLAHRHLGDDAADVSQDAEFSHYTALVTRFLVARS